MNRGRQGQCICARLRWIWVPCGTSNAAGPDSPTTAPFAERVYPEAYHPRFRDATCPSPSSRDIVKTPARSSPAGERLSLTVIVGRRSAAHRDLEATIRMVSRSRWSAQGSETMRALNLRKSRGDQQRHRRTSAECSTAWREKNWPCGDSTVTSR